LSLVRKGWVTCNTEENNRVPCPSLQFRHIADLPFEAAVHALQ
jgi:hypothetical protein